MTIGKDTLITILLPHSRVGPKADAPDFVYLSMRMQILFDPMFLLFKGFPKEIVKDIGEDIATSIFFL